MLYIWTQRFGSLRRTSAGANNDNSTGERPSIDVTPPSRINMVKSHPRMPNFRKSEASLWKKYGRRPKFQFHTILHCFIAGSGSASRVNCSGDLRKPGNFYVAVAIVDCPPARASGLTGSWTAGTIGDEGGLLGSGGAFKSGRLKKKAICAPADVYTLACAAEIRGLFTSNI